MGKAWMHGLIAGCLSLLVACGSDNELGVVKVGIVQGPAEGPLTAAAQRYASRNLKIGIQPVTFNTYEEINIALCEGRVDANVAQSLPFLLKQLKSDPKLKAVMQSTNCELVPITRTFIYPFGLYSRQITDLSQVPQQGVVAVPEQAVNLSRALLLLQKAGLIQIRPSAGIFATIQDITNNPYQLVIVPIDVSRLPSIIAGASLVVMNSNYAALAGLYLRNALAVEDSLSYATIIVVRKDQAQNIKFAQLATAYHSPDAIKEAAKVSNGAAIQAWGGTIMGLSNTALPTEAEAMDTNDASN